VSNGRVKALWLGPQKWLLVTQDNQMAKLKQDLKQAFESTTYLMSDYSDARFAVSVSGHNARKFISKACTLNLNEHSFKTGRCAQSLFAHIPMLIHQTSPLPCYHLYFDTSFAGYLWRWLKDAALEFDLHSDKTLDQRVGA